MNKAISTPIAIIIVLIMAVVIGGIVVWQYLTIPEDEIVSEEIGRSLEEEKEELGDVEETDISNLEEQYAEIQNIDVSRWDFYEENGYQLRYPEDFSSSKNIYSFYNLEELKIETYECDHSQFPESCPHKLKDYSVDKVRSSLALAFGDEMINIEGVDYCFLDSDSSKKFYITVKDDKCVEIYIESSCKSYDMNENHEEYKECMNYVEAIDRKIVSSLEFYCIDSDGGSIYIPGQIMNKGQNDYCIDDNTLGEYYCLDNKTDYFYKEEVCQNGCNFGACQPSWLVNSEHVYLDYSFGCFWPTFRNLNNNILNRINQLISFKDVTGLYNSCEDFKIATNNNRAYVSYQVNYDKRNILNFSITAGGCWAYCSENEHNYIINLTNGELVNISDIFYSDEIVNLLDYLNIRLQNNINEQIDHVKESNPAGEGNLCSEDDVKKSGKFTEKNLLNLKIMSDGIEFIYEFAYPHAIQACEPDGEIFLTYDELKQFIDKDGLLGHEVD